MLNVGAQRTWAYPCTSFPLVEIDQDGCAASVARRSAPRSASSSPTTTSPLSPATEAGPELPGRYTVTYARISDGPVEAIATGALIRQAASNPTLGYRWRCPDSVELVPMPYTPGAPPLDQAAQQAAAPNPTPDQPPAARTWSTNRRRGWTTPTRSAQGNRRTGNPTTIRAERARDAVPVKD